MKFHEYFRRVYGERWEGLVTAMRAPVSHTAMINPFLSPIEQEETEGRLTTYNYSEVRLRRGVRCLRNDARSIGSSSSKKSKLWPQPSRSRQQDLLDYYLLDPASVLAALVRSRGDHRYS